MDIGDTDKWIGREVIRNGSNDSGRVLFAVRRPDRTVELTISTDHGTVHSDSEHWTVRRSRDWTATASQSGSHVRWDTSRARG